MAALLPIESPEMLKSLIDGSDTYSGIVVHYLASWCDPCKALNEYLLKKASLYHGKVLICFVDVEKVPEEMLTKENVETVPHVVFYRKLLGRPGHERVADIFGAKFPVLDRNFSSLYGQGLESPSNHASMDDFLKYLINKDKITIFITGTPSRPRCGFTGKLIELFNELEVPYTYYDIMANDDVCDALKKFSNWPTYPQVYVEGELIGGLDIVKELHSQGELMKTLKLPERPKA
jgi:Grx4 family monothiol glutaredoxin